MPNKKLGEVIMGLALERNAEVSKLQRVQATDHELVRVTHCLTIEEVVCQKFEDDEAQKEQLATNPRERKIEKAPLRWWWRSCKKRPRLPKR